MFPSSGVRGKCGEKQTMILGELHLPLFVITGHIAGAAFFSKSDTMRWQIGCQRIHVILKIVAISLTERGNTCGKIDFSERSGQNLGHQHRNSGCRPQQWPNLLCSVCAEWLCVLYGCGPSGVYRKMYPSCEADGKGYNIPQTAKCQSMTIPYPCWNPSYLIKQRYSAGDYF